MAEQITARAEHGVALSATERPAGDGVMVPVSILNAVAYVRRSLDPERQMMFDREYDAALEGIRAIIVAHEAPQSAALSAASGEPIDG